MRDEILQIRYTTLFKFLEFVIYVLSTMNKENSVVSGYTKTFTIQFIPKLAGYILGHIYITLFIFMGYITCMIYQRLLITTVKMQQ